MKPLLTLILSIFLAINAVAEDDSFDAKIQFETREIKLGDIAHSYKDRDFSFTGINTGNAPLVLTYVHPSCNCVRVQYPREPIAPGDTLHIRGTFSPHGLSSGPFRRDIIIRSNAIESKIRLLITGNIIAER